MYTVLKQKQLRQHEYEGEYLALVYTSMWSSVSQVNYGPATTEQRITHPAVCRVTTSVTVV